MNPAATPRQKAGPKQWSVALLLLSTLQLSGCVGLAAVYPGTDVYDDPVQGHPTWGGESPILHRAIHRDREPIPISELVRQWGPPRQLERLPDGRERYRFKSQESPLIGLLPAVIVAIPLVLPAGRAYWDVYVRDGIVIRALHWHGKGVGYICSLHSKPGVERMGPGCEDFSAP